jgi:hypothetical protein
MKFSSIKEFFYKLQSMCYAFLLLPLGILIALYVVPQRLITPFRIEGEETLIMMRILLPVIALVELTTVHWVISSKLKTISVLPSLGDRLDKYVPLAFMRTLSALFVSFLMLIGIFLTGDSWFTGYTVVMLLIIFLQRPTPASVSSQLQLRGNEKELILKGELA